MKQALRDQIRRRLAAITPDRTASAQICDRIAAFDVFRRAKMIMIIAPLPGEPDIRPLADLALGAGKRLCLPRVDWSARTMVAAAVGSLAGLEATRHGLMQPPAEAAVVPPDQIDLILVPGMAFDPAGRRLGRGGGFYDRFLASLPAPRPYLCGVAFDVQIVDALPADSWDQRVDAIATENRCIVPE